MLFYSLHLPSRSDPCKGVPGTCRVALLLADNYVTKNLFNIIGLFKSLSFRAAHVITLVILEISFNGLICYEVY